MDQSGKDCKTQCRGTEMLGSHRNFYAPGGQGVIYGGSVVLYYHCGKSNGRLMREVLVILKSKIRQIWELWLRLDGISWNLVVMVNRLSLSYRRSFISQPVKKESF